MQFPDQKCRTEAYAGVLFLHETELSGVLPPPAVPAVHVDASRPLASSESSVNYWSGAGFYGPDIRRAMRRDFVRPVRRWNIDLVCLPRSFIVEALGKGCRRSAQEETDAAYATSYVAPHDSSVRS